MCGCSVSPIFFIFLVLRHFGFSLGNCNFIFSSLFVASGGEHKSAQQWGPLMLPSGWTTRGHTSLTARFPPAMKPLRDFRTRAAVRFIEAGTYDAHDLPLVSEPQKKTSKFSLKRSLRSVASCLAFKAGPNLLERDISIEGSSPGEDFRFVVRHVVQGSTHSGGANRNSSDIFASYSLRELVDLSVFSVGEKGQFVFKASSESLYSSCAVASRTKSNTVEKGVPSSSSSLVSQGEVGLEVVFKVSSVGLSLVKDQFQKIEIHFMSSKERNVWLQFLENVYVSNLLDSIQTEDHDGLSSAEMETLMAENDRLMREKPPPAVIERYIDFFLSSPGYEVSHEVEVEEITDPNDAPFGGILRIGLGDGKYEIRRFAYKKAAKCLESSEQEFLVIYPTTVTQHIRMLSKCKIPISQLRVVVEEEHWGNAFFLEQTAGTTDTHRESLLCVCESHLAKFQSAFAVPKPTCGGDFVITETIELHADSFSSRIKWLKWFEAVLKKPVVYLSRFRDEKEAHETMQNPARRATSLYPESTEAGTSES